MARVDDAGRAREGRVGGESPSLVAWSPDFWVEISLDSRYLAAHRELILSSFTASEAPPFVIRRPLCLAMNERTAAMVAAVKGR